MATTPIEQSFIQHWKSLNLSNWNETDVREDFIAPLLRVLGYAKNTVDGIIREQSLSLSEKYHRIGRDRVKVDYVPTVRLKQFWIIEAKPASPSEMEYGDLLQAHLYAVHPEMQARYIVITNAHEIRVYDSIRADKWDDAIFVSKQTDCETTFSQLATFLGAKTMLQSIRDHSLKALEESLALEIDESAAQEVQRTIYKITNKAIPKIRQNALNIQRKAWSESQERARKELQDCSFETLLIMMDIPTDTVPIYGKEFIRRFGTAGSKEQGVMLDKLAMTYRGRPHSIFRVHCADIFSRLMFSGHEAKRSTYVNSVAECLDELADGSLTYWSHSDLSNALVHLDNTTLRLSKKLCMRLCMAPIKKLVEEQRKHLSVEDQLRNRPHVAGYMIREFGLQAERFWRQYSSASDAETVWKAIWQLEEVEKIIELMPEQKYPNQDGDLLWFESYGRGFDILLMGTWDLVGRGKTGSDSSKLPASVKRLISMSREEAIAAIPKSRANPNPADLPEHAHKMAEVIMNVSSRVFDSAFKPTSPQSQPSGPTSSGGSLDD